MKRISVVLLVVLILIQCLTFSVFAATDDEPGFIWTIIDSIGDFFSNLAKSIVNLGKYLKDVFLSAMEFLLNGLKKLFIPRDDYFDKMTERVYKAFSKKFGGVLGLADYLKTRFSTLRASTENLFVIKFPKNHFFNGLNLDILKNSRNITDMIRGAFSGFVVLCTVAFCYKKVTAMINS